MTEQMSFSPEEFQKREIPDFSGVESDSKELPSTREGLQRAIAEHEAKLEDIRSRIEKLDNNPRGESMADLRKSLFIEDKFISLYRSRLRDLEEKAEASKPVEQYDPDSPFTEAYKAIDKHKNK